MAGDVQEPVDQEAHWARRVGWMVLIWAGSILALGLVALAFRVIMSWVGLTR